MMERWWCGCLTKFGLDWHFPGGGLSIYYADEPRPARTHCCASALIGLGWAGLALLYDTYTIRYYHFILFLQNTSLFYPADHHSRTHPPPCFFDSPRASSVHPSERDHLESIAMYTRLNKCGGADESKRET